MRIRAVTFSILTGLVLVTALFLSAILQASAAGSAQEADLNSSGEAYEVNIDSTGQLWISDLIAGEIWQVNPGTGAYTVFQDIPAPSDARRAPNGMVWWGDFDEGRFGRLNPATREATWWDVPTVTGLWGTQIDPVSGDFWVVGNEEPYLFRFQPATSQLCTYTLPSNAIVYYPKIHAGKLWLGDANNSRLLRLDPDSDSITIWNLLEFGTPEGMAVDATNALWFAEPIFGSLMRFQPDTNQLDTFDVPVGLTPQMVAIQGDNVWYTEYYSATIGRLDPATAVHGSSTLVPGTTSITPTCSLVSPAPPDTVGIDHGVLNWSAQTYPLLVESDGWMVYQLPEPDISYPWGIAADPTHIWFVDKGRQVLGRLDTPGGYDVYLPLVLR